MGQGSRACMRGSAGMVPAVASCMWEEGQGTSTTGRGWEGVGQGG